jgi:hypothetical protein
VYSRATESTTNRGSREDAKRCSQMMVVAWIVAETRIGASVGASVIPWSSFVAAYGYSTVRDLDAFGPQA